MVNPPVCATETLFYVLKYNYYYYQLFSNLQFYQKKRAKMVQKHFFFNKVPNYSFFYIHYRFETFVFVVEVF